MKAIVLLQYFLASDVIAAGVTGTAFGILLEEATQLPPLPRTSQICSLIVFASLEKIC